VFVVIKMIFAVLEHRWLIQLIQDI